MTKPGSPADSIADASADVGEDRKTRVQLAWVFTLFVAFTLGLVLSPVAKLGIYLFPAASFIVALYVYVRSKPDYASFVCWLYLLTPLVRRLVDYRAGWIPATAVLVAPLLGCFAPMPFLFFQWRKLVARALPVLVTASAIAYSVGVGLLSRNSPVFLALSTTAIAAPVCFGLFLGFHRADSPRIFQALRNALIRSLPVMSLYGLYQFFFLPKWDALWMESSNLVSIGLPAPLQVRVFGTSNSPQALAAFLVIGLFFTFQSSSRLKFISIPIGLFTLALTSARSAWVGFIIGLLYLFFHLPARQRLQMAASAALAVVLIVLALQTDAQQAVFARVQSLSDPSHDDSFASRYAGYSALLPSALSQPYGYGLGYDPSQESKGNGEGLAGGDSALIALIIPFGLPGALVYLAGLALMLKSWSTSNDPGVVILKACAWSLAAEALLTDILQGPGGFLLWTSLALGFAMVSRAKPTRPKVSLPATAGLHLQVR